MADIDLTTTATVPTGTSLSITVCEDVDQDGVDENQATQAVSTGTNTYTLSGFDASGGNDYWLSFEFGTTDVETTASLESATVVVESAIGVTDSGSITLCEGVTGTSTETPTSVGSAVVSPVTASSIGSTDTSSSFGSAIVSPAAASPTVSSDSSGVTDDGFSVPAVVSPITAVGELTALPIGGTVNLEGSPVSGATVIGINDTREEVQAITTTDSTGKYSIAYPVGEVAHLKVQHEDGSEQYNTQSKPFVVTE